MRWKANLITLFVLLLLCMSIIIPDYNELEATSQWARKYGTQCTTCHTAFPRLNYYGEEFMRNGYQIPGDRDGDETNKEDLGDLYLGSVDDMFGLRINLQPLKIEQNGLITRENGTVDTTTKISLGRANWLQLFTAGSIFKDASIFIETEFDTDSKKFKNSWFRVGFHNLFGPQGAANIRVGQLSPMEWTALSGRLRMIPSVKIHSISKILSSDGKGDDAVPLASAQPGLEFYGFQGPVGYSVGVVNGKTGTDVNNFKNLFGTLRLEKVSGSTEGSSVTLWGYLGKDSKIGNDAASPDDEVNEFWRVSPAFNLRYGELDLIGALFIGNDDNWTLLDSNMIENDFTGAAFQAGYFFNPKVYGVLQYDWVDSDDFPSMNFSTVTPSLWFFPRENMRIGLTAVIDLLEESADHPLKKSTFDVTIRSMF